jgi:hypothetical protein
MVASGSDSASEGDQRTEKKRKYSQAATQETSRRTADDGDGTSSSLVQEKASPAKKVRTEPRHSEFLEEYIALGSAEAGTTDSRYTSTTALRCFALNRGEVPVFPNIFTHGNRADDVTGATNQATWQANAQTRPSMLTSHWYTSSNRPFRSICSLP